MNVLLVTQDINALRVGSVAQEALKEYSISTNRLVVLVLNTQRNPFTVSKVSNALWIIPTNSLFNFIAPFTALRITARELYFQGRLHADVVAAEDPCRAGFTAWIIGLRFRCPLQIHIGYNVLSTSYGRESVANKIRMYLARFIVTKADALRINSKAILSSLAGIHTDIANRAQVLARFFDVDAVQSEPVRVNLQEKYPQFKFILLMVVPLWHVRQIEFTMLVLSKVLAYYSHAGLVVVGEGRASRRLRRFAEKLNMTEHIAFETPGDNMISFYKTAHVYLMTDPHEDYNDTVATALSAGCAIISTNVGIASTIISNDETGFICDPQDSSCFVRAILKMLNDPSSRDRVRLNGMLALESSTGTNKQAYAKQYAESWQQAIILTGGHVKTR